MIVIRHAHPRPQHLGLIVNCDDVTGECQAREGTSDDEVAANEELTQRNARVLLGGLGALVLATIATGYLIYGR